MLVNLTSEAFAVACRILRRVCGIAVIHRRLLVENFVDQLFGFVDAVGNRRFVNGFAVKACHFNVSVHRADNAGAVCDLLFGKHVLCAAGAIGFNLNGNAHFFSRLFQRFGCHIGVGDAGRAGGDCEDLIARFGCLFYNRLLGIFLSLGLVDDCEIFRGRFCRTQLCAKRGIHEHDHQTRENFKMKISVQRRRDHKQDV